MSEYSWMDMMINEKLSDIYVEEYREKKGGIDWLCVRTRWIFQINYKMVSTNIKKG